jgi:hypothetical protein
VSANHLGTLRWQLVSVVNAGFQDGIRPLRLAARETWVGQWYDELVEVQAEADQQSAAGP